MNTKYWFYELLRCPGDWTFIPWIRTRPGGWMFTFWFFGFGRMALSQDDIDYLLCEGEEDSE